MSTHPELLMRSAPLHKNAVDDGIPSASTIFRVNDNDGGCLSVDRGEVWSPQRSYQYHTEPSPNGRGKRIVGIWGVSKDELKELGLSWREDPLPGPNPPENPAHALIQVGSDKTEPRFKDRLWLLANRRGRLYPESPTPSPLETT